MRDAFCRSFMIRIFLIFILIYILLTAVAMNYAKAYKVKELVVAYLEDNEVDIATMNAEEESKFRDYISNKIVHDLNYAPKTGNLTCPEPDHKNCFIYDNIILIVKKEPAKVSNKRGAYYVVNTYFAYNIGLLKKLIQSGNNNSNASIDNNAAGIWKITGETRLIFNEVIPSTD